MLSQPEMNSKLDASLGIHNKNLSPKAIKRRKGAEPVAAHTFNPSTQKAEAGRSLKSRPAWAARATSAKTGYNATEKP